MTRESSSLKERQLGSKKSILYEYPSNKWIEINPLNAELNPIHHLLAFVGARHIVHVSRIRVKHLFQNKSPLNFGQKRPPLQYLSYIHFPCSPC